ncbi:MAG: nitroreductase family protein [Candidatus Bathyarchaeia archaeon]
MYIVLDLARERVTSRRFSDRPVDVGDVLPAIEAASQAPSGANYQPWRFLIVTESELKTRIREASEEGERRFYSRVEGAWAEWLELNDLNPRKPYLENAPLLVIVLSHREAPYSKESVWLAIGYILLALQELGLATVTYTPSDPDLVLDVLDVPENLSLEAILPVGYPDDDKQKEERFELSQLYRINRWNDTEN